MKPIKSYNNLLKLSNSVSRYPLLKKKHLEKKILKQKNLKTVNIRASSETSIKNLVQNRYLLKKNKNKDFEFIKKENLRVVLRKYKKIYSSKIYYYMKQYRKEREYIQQNRTIRFRKKKKYKSNLKKTILRKLKARISLNRKRKAIYIRSRLPQALLFSKKKIKIKNIKLKTFKKKRIVNKKISKKIQKKNAKIINNKISNMLKVLSKKEKNGVPFRENSKNSLFNLKFLNFHKNIDYAPRSNIKVNYKKYYWFEHEIKRRFDFRNLRKRQVDNIFIDGKMQRKAYRSKAQYYKIRGHDNLKEEVYLNEINSGVYPIDKDFLDWMWMYKNKKLKKSYFLAKKKKMKKKTKIEFTSPGFSKFLKDRKKEARRFKIRYIKPKFKKLKRRSKSINNVNQVKKIYL